MKWSPPLERQEVFKNEKNVTHFHDFTIGQLLRCCAFFRRYH